MFMKKVIALIVISLILTSFISAGISLTTKAVEDNENDSNDSGQDYSESNSNSESNNDLTDEERIRIRERTRTEFSREVETEEGTIKIEREVEIKDGEVRIKIKKTVTSADGSEREVNIELERYENGSIKRDIEIEGENITLGREIEINDLFEGNESELEAVLSNGNTSRIRILPERAREIIQERLRTRNISRINLEEIEYRNVPRVVYNIEANQNGRFLGIFKLRLKAETQIDPETGEVLDINRPWWAFLVVPEEE